MTRDAGTGTSELDTATAWDSNDRAASLWSDAWIQVRRRPLFWVCISIITILIVASIFPGWFTSQDPRDCTLRDTVLRPSREHWFGTDKQGCDYYALTVYGTRKSISIGLLVTSVSSVIALVLGSLAGYFGGWIDTIIARITDVWFSIPSILGAIVLLTVVEDRFGRTILSISLVLAVFGWPTMLRLVRSAVITVKENDYVDAARALGASDFRILTRHILPNAITPVIVYATITVGVVIAAEATLTFLGVGFKLPSISWGLMIGKADQLIRTTPHLLLFPGAFLSITVFAFILLGDVLRDALDPKLR